MKKQEIKLGDQVKCKITGFTGTATARTEFLNGCIQINVAPKMKKGDVKIPDEIGIDEQSLEVVNKKKKKVKKSDDGGANRLGVKFRGF